MARKQPGGTPATVALTRANVTFKLHQFENDPRVSSYGREAAEALGADPARIFKTLIATLDPSGGSGQARFVVGVVPVSGQLDLKRFARALGGARATLAEVRAAERATGYVVGGISPVGQRHAHPTVLDDHALVYPAIFVSGGRRGLEIEISPADLVAVTGAITAPIAR